MIWIIFFLIILHVQQMLQIRVRIKITITYLLAIMKPSFIRVLYYSQTFGASPLRRNMYFLQNTCLLKLYLVPNHCCNHGEKIKMNSSNYFERGKHTHECHDNFSNPLYIPKCRNLLPSSEYIV
jgi:hypothetical protein